MFIRRTLIICSSLLLVTATVSSAQHASLAPTAPGSGASAQEAGTRLTRLMLGIDVKQTVTPGDEAANRSGVGLMWRWRSRTPRMDDRFAFAYGLGSYSTRVSGNILGQGVEIGDVQLRQLVAGVDYKMPRGKWTWSVGAVTGVSRTKLRTNSSLLEHVHSATGEHVRTDISNSFTWIPRFKGWYDVNRRVSFMIETSYNYSRPKITIWSGGMEMSRRINADALLFKAGVVYGV